MTDEQREGQYRIKPTAGRILIKLVTLANKTASGLWIPDSAQPDRPSTGIVHEVFDPYYEDGLLQECDFKVGDKVMFGQHSGTKFRVGRHKDAEDFILMREVDVMATLHDLALEAVEPGYG